MTNYQKIRLISRKVEKGARFVSFSYKKDDGTTSNRTVLFNVKIGAAMEKRGKPVTGKGNWHSKCEEGRNGFILRRGGELYARGIDNKDNKLKIFKCSGIQLT